MNIHTPAQSRVVLVTGGSSGIGWACCKQLSAQGHEVFGASRSKPEAAAWTHLRMDVSEDSSVEDCVASVLASAGRIDAVVHCAGVSLMGPFEETTGTDALQHFEVNYFGPVRVLRAVLPAMRRQHSGTVIIIGSIGGLIGLPFLSHYCAAKSALDRLVESIRLELSEFDIDITLLHAGNVRTGFSDRNNIGSAIKSSSPYLDEFTRSAEFYRRCEAVGSMPSTLARRINRALDRGQLPPRLVEGALLEKIGVTAKRLLPARLFEKALRSFYGP